MIENLSKEDILCLGNEFYDDQLYIVCFPVLNQKCREEIAMKPEESWYYALKILNRLKESKRGEFEIIRIRSELEEELSEYHSYAFSRSATFIILWCVFYMLISYFKDRPSPYKEIENSIIGMLRDNDKLSSIMCHSVYQIEGMEESKGRFVSRRDYVEFASAFFEKYKHSNNAAPDYDDSLELLFTPEAVIYWRRLRDAGLVDKDFKRPVDKKFRESAVIAYYFCEKLNLKNVLWQPFQKFWGISNLAQYYYQDSTAKKELSSLHKIKSVFDL